MHSKNHLMCNEKPLRICIFLSKVVKLSMQSMNYFQFMDFDNIKFKFLWLLNKSSLIKTYHSFVLKKRAFKDHLPSRYICSCALALHRPYSMYQRWDHLILITFFNYTPYLCVVGVIQLTSLFTVWSADPIYSYVTHICYVEGYRFSTSTHENYQIV